MTQTLVPVLLVLAAISQVHCVCKPGWQSWGGRCFFMSSATKNWSEPRFNDDIC